MKIIYKLLPLIFITYSLSSEISPEHYEIIKENNYRILGMGVPIIDLLIPVTANFLKTIPGKKGGAEEISLQMLEQIIINSGTKPKIATGGSCANTIKGIASLGESCALLGNVGRGEWGDLFTHSIKKAGVIPLLFPGSASPACVLCLITPDGQRTMRFYEGCSRELTPTQLDIEYINKAEIVHLEGYSLRNQNLVETMMQFAKKKNVTVSFDLSCFEIVENFHDDIDRFLSNGYIDILFANEEEAQTFTGLETENACRRLLENCPVVVILQGEKGCMVGSREKIFQSPPIPTKVIDTTGAGDLFASGFLFGYLRGYPLEKCAYFGNLLGSAVVTVIGAEIPEDQWPTLRKLIH